MSKTIVFNDPAKYDVTEDLSVMASQFKEAPSCKSCKQKIASVEEVTVNITCRGMGPDEGKQEDTR